MGKHTMELQSAGECTIYKNGENTKVLNDTSAFIPRGQKELKLKPFDTLENLKKEKENTIKELELEAEL